jgi:hypothetical protein
MRLRRRFAFWYHCRKIEITNIRIPLIIFIYSTFSMEKKSIADLLGGIGLMYDAATRYIHCCPTHNNYLSRIPMIFDYGGGGVVIEHGTGHFVRISWDNFISAISQMHEKKQCINEKYYFSIIDSKTLPIKPTTKESTRIKFELLLIPHPKNPIINNQRNIVSRLIVGVLEAQAQLQSMQKDLEAEKSKLKDLMKDMPPEYRVVVMKDLDGSFGDFQ